MTFRTAAGRRPLTAVPARPLPHPMPFHPPASTAGSRPRSAVRPPGAWCALLLLGLVLGLLPAPLAAEVVLNEVQSWNETTAVDEDGDASDWIELLNRGPDPVDLAGWGLSDRVAEPFQWVMPQLVLQPGERTLVWASGKDRREPAPAPPYDSPDDVPGLVLWLDAAREAFSNSDPVAVWSDRSGHGNHALAPTSAARPTFVTGAVNGLPALRFTRSAGHVLHLPTTGFDGLEHFADITLVVAAKWAGGTVCGYLGAWGGSGNSGNTHFEIPGAQELRLRVAAMNDLRKPGAVVAGAWAVLAASMHNAGDTPLARLIKDGVELAAKSQAPGTCLLSNYDTLALGQSDPSGRFFNGDIAEVLLYNRSLAPAELDFVNRHLALRYGLATGPPTATSGLHTSFRIDAEGETIVLTRPDATTADLLPAAAVPPDASRGRAPDGSPAVAWFATPTPGAPNTTTASGPPVDPPAVSHPRGLQQDAFSLTLSHPDPLVTIRYTTDGSEPREDHGAIFTTPLPVASTTVLRAAAFKPGALPVRRIVTHSYLFLDDLIGVTARPPGYPETWNGFAQTSYAISPHVAAQEGYAAEMKSALLALPTLSLAIGPDEMFGSGGVYANPTIEGFELPASAEWIGLPGTPDLQIDAGLRIQGGASRLFSNTPKKSLRLLFRGSLGQGRLTTPVLAAGGTAMADFNTLVLRGDYNNSWVHWDPEQRLRGTMVRDQWMRDTQVAMCGIGSRGNHVHLYVNGLYWGVYNPSERPDAAFAASYLGGERDDYDAMTHDGIRDGDNIAWNEMRALAQAGLASPEQYAAIQQFLDVDHFIDYMIVNIYGGNLDWPQSNWNATRLRQPGAGYLFHCWDAERSLEDPATNRVGVTGSNNPAEFYAALRANPEFRLRFADHLRKHFFHGGALTPEACIARYHQRATPVAAAIFGEQARWGAYRFEIYDRNGPSPRYALDPHWLAERDRLVGSYFPARSAVVLDQFRAAGLYPLVDPPELSVHGGLVDPGLQVTLGAPAGAIHYTLDGSDPRVPVTGAVAPGASHYTGTPLLINGRTTVKARALDGGTWSALTEAAFLVEPPEPVFLPAGSGDWTLGTHWSGMVYPNAPGARALIPAPAADDRNVELRAPVTVGRITFDEQASPFRDRVRDRDTGNTLTFDGGGGEPPRVRVEGTGTGHAEFDVEAGGILQQTLELQVNHLGGDPVEGALRLRSPWRGPGGIRKTGPGMASLTGAAKEFTGPVEVAEGVLAITEASAPAQAASVAVLAGAQLRLVSASIDGQPRHYLLPSPLQIAGPGRAASLPDDAGLGKLGALRADPESGGINCAVVPVPVELTAPATIHVEGHTTRLELPQPLAGPHPLAKTGGGTLALGPEQSGFVLPVSVANGSLELSGPLGSPVDLATPAVLTGHGGCGAITGAGTVDLGRAVLAAPAAAGVAVAALLGRPGAPDPATPDDAGNGLLRLATAPGALAGCRAYLAATADRLQGVLWAPFDAGLPATLRAIPCAAFVPDPQGEHIYAGQAWSPAAAVQWTTAPVTLDFGSGPIAGRIVELRVNAPPASFAAWQLLAFPDPADLADPTVSGPLADPSASGVANVLRHALGLGPHDPPHAALPRLAVDATHAHFRFPFDPGRDDVACIVEASDHLADWSQADVLFDSRSDWPAGLTDGWLTVSEPVAHLRRFFRLRVELLA